MAAPGLKENWPMPLQMAGPLLPMDSIFVLPVRLLANDNLPRKPFMEFKERRQNSISPGNEQVHDAWSLNGRGLFYFIICTTLIFRLFTPLPAQAAIAFRAAASNTVQTQIGVNPTFVASSNAQTAGNGDFSLILSKPVGVNANNVLIAQVAIQGLDFLNTPAGWTLIESRSSTQNGREVTQAVYWRIATASEPASYTWSWASSKRASGGILAFSNVDTTNPVDAAGGQVANNSTSMTAPSQTQTTNNAMLVVFFASGEKGSHTAPAGMTEVYDQNTFIGSNGFTTSGLYESDATAGATGNRVSTGPGGDNIGHLIVLRPSFGSLTIAKPTGTTTDDVMIASVAYAPCSSVSGAACTTTIAPPAGWTLIRTVDTPTGSGPDGYGSRLFIYRRVATTSEPLSYTWYFGGTPVHAGAAGGILSFSGVDTSSPIVTENGQATANSNNHTAPSIDTGAVTDTMLISSHAVNSSGTWTAPGGMTEQVDIASRTPNNDPGVSLEINTEIHAVAGTTGTRTASLSNPPASDTGAAHMLALRPAEGGSNGVNPANFNCVETGANASAGTIYTKLAGTPFSFDVVALKTDGNVEAGYVTSTNKNVTVELVDGSGITACAGRAVLSPAVAQTLSFSATDQGRKAIAPINLGNAYANLRCRVADANQSPSIIGCSSDNFAVRPTGFSVAASANADATGASVSATPIIKAGANLTLTAASGTAGYNYAPQLDISKVTAHAGASQNGILTGSFTAADATNGTATGTTFNYSEAGYFKLAANGVYDDAFTVVDSAVSDCTSDFSNVSVNGKYGCKFGNTEATGYFGRFIPDHFALTQGLATPGCGSVFTYFGQDGFATSFTLTAQNSGNATTQNYTGAFAKLALTSWNNFVFTSSGLPEGAILSASATAPAGSWSNGVASVIAKHQISRPTALTGQTPVIVNAAPVDADGVTLPSAQVAPATPLRYGRINLGNAHGSELLDLAMPMQAEYYSGTSFIANTDDLCSASSLTIADPEASDTLQASDTCIWDDSITSGSANCTAAAPIGKSYKESGSLASGSFNVNLKAPGKTGALTINADVPDWLKFNWQNAGNVNPSARATFGIFKGSDKFIYFREVY
jgi:hypothetical protein